MFVRFHVIQLNCDCLNYNGVKLRDKFVKNMRLKLTTPKQELIFKV